MITNSKTPSFYQQYYKTRNPASKSREVISSHVREIINATSPHLRTPFHKVVMLDVGSAKGEYSFEFEKYVKRTVAVEPYAEPYKIAQHEKKILNSKVKFYNVPIENLYTNEKFDFVLCLTVIEHMPNAEESFKKIFSLLKIEGVIYLTAPNKLWPMESHYKLLFLSWLPLPLANFYMRLTGKGKSYEDSAYSKTYLGMRSFFNKFPCTYSFALPKNIDGAFMGCGSGGLLYKSLMKLGIYLIKNFPMFWFFSKGFIMVIKKS